MGKAGRPKGPKNSQKRVFTTRLTPALIKRIEVRAEKERRPKNNLVENILEESV